MRAPKTVRRQPAKIRTRRPRKIAARPKTAGRGNANDFLAAALGGEIVSGLYQPGERLPSEASLLQRFNVSRPTLREAFRALAAKGLIVSRQKVGTSVRPKSEWNALDPDFLSWHLHHALTDGFIGDLFQFRLMVEPQAAFLAAQTHGEGALNAIATAYDDMESAPTGSDEFLRADLAFHRAILAATGNLFVGALGGLIGAALLGSFRLSWQAGAPRENRLAQHRDVLDAIRAQQPEEARDRMARLLSDAVRDARDGLAADAPAQPIAG